VACKLPVKKLLLYGFDNFVDLCLKEPLEMAAASIR
jgi:hypothetical protein